jgi:hypothetical protein
MKGYELAALEGGPSAKVSKVHEAMRRKQAGKQGKGRTEGLIIIPRYFRGSFKDRKMK